jgi:hypothetical protein
MAGGANRRRRRMPGSIGLQRQAPSTLDRRRREGSRVAHALGDAGESCRLLGSSLRQQLDQALESTRDRDPLVRLSRQRDQCAQVPRRVEPIAAVERGAVLPARGRTPAPVGPRADRAARALPRHKLVPMHGHPPPTPVDPSAPRREHAASGDRARRTTPSRRPRSQPPGAQRERRQRTRVGVACPRAVHPPAGRRRPLRPQPTAPGARRARRQSSTSRAPSGKPGRIEVAT